MKTLVLGFALLLVAQPAHAVTRDLVLCLEFRKDFADAKGGDWWTDNSTNAMGRGLLVEINDDAANNKIGRVSETTGCRTWSVAVSAPQYTVTVKVYGDAKVSGVQIQSFEDDTATSGVDLADNTRISTFWQFVAVPSNPTTSTKYLPETGPWMHLAVATMVFRRSDFNITDDVSRDCCTDDGAVGYDEDGTCTSPDYATVDPPVRIHHGAGCGGSTVRWENGVELIPRYPAASLSEDGCGKFVVAHELGHVIEMMRTGAYVDNGTEPDPYDLAALDGCDGRGDTGLGDAGRGRFTKEYMSLAFREGWADFVTTWTWNKRTETDCSYQKVPGSQFQDFDLDGTVDNDETNNDYDRIDDCAGTPFVHHDTATPMDNTNWLDDLQDTAYVDHCSRDSDNDVEANRSTVYDVAKMFWQLNNTNGQGVAIDTLTDLYVDMCPRQWAATDDEASADGVYVEDDLPLERLKISAAEHSLTTELNAVIDQVEH